MANANSNNMQASGRRKRGRGRAHMRHASIATTVDRTSVRMLRAPTRNDERVVRSTEPIGGWVDEATRQAKVLAAPLVVRAARRRRRKAPGDRQ